MAAITLRAYAKLNLYLHLLGRRADGYHTLESLVAFTDFADSITLNAAPALSLDVVGEFAADAGSAENNLVVRAANALQAYTSTALGAHITLTKNIPVGAGLGGGSADAAAVLRGLNRMWQLSLDKPTLSSIAAKLGADVAMCLDSVPAIARGVGELVTPSVQPLPHLNVLLVHPRVALLTKQVYAAVDMPTSGVASWLGVTQPPAAFFEGLTATRNHLQRAAITVDPQVAQLLLALEMLQPAANFVRMSGSGACCYALFEDATHCARAAENMTKNYPHWWVAQTTLRNI